MPATKTPAKKTLKAKKIIRKPTKAAETKSAAKAAEPVVTIDRRAAAAADRRGSTATDRRVKGEPVAVERRSLERRAKVSRRRQIDPTTCERDYTTEEVEFMSAMDDYKRRSGRMFPTCSEVLEVIRKLGYRKVAEEPVLVEAAPVAAMLEAAPSPVVLV